MNMILNIYIRYKNDAKYIYDMNNYDTEVQLNVFNSKQN